jgi:hypothetical protein
MTTHRQAAREAHLRIALAVLLTLTFGSVLHAQTCATAVTTEPSNPTSATPVYLRFEGPGLDDQCQSTTVEVVGHEVRIETNFECLITGFTSTRRQLVGVLPAGDYTVVIHDQYSDCYAYGSFTVTATLSVPVLSHSFQLLLLVVLAAFGVLATRSQIGG